MLKADDVKTLGFLVLPGFPMSCLTSAIEPLRAANEIAGRNTFDWLVVGESDAPVVSSAHVSFDPDISLEALDHIDFLFFMSGPNGQFQNPKSAYGKIRRLDRQGLNLGGFSGGVFPLTRSGVMQGYRCSVHWCYQAAYEAEFSETVSVESVITIDRKRYTVSGASGVFDLMLKFIDDALGSEIMTEVACWFQHPLVRGEGVSQKIPTLKSASTADMLPDSVSKSIQLFAEHIEDPILISDVAREVETSTRQLVRSFKRSTGQSLSVTIA